ncbi:MAG: Fic family protein [Clostridia bacterium]
MEDKIEVITLLQEKQILVSKLNSLIYGAIEIREKNSKKYIYVHCRENGIVITKYVGEYLDELYNLILNNNIESKKIKKNLREKDKKLKQLNYIEEDLKEEVELNIDFAKRHLIDTIYKQAILEGVATTLTDTENIIEGGKVSNMTSEDVMKIINLKHAWEFILNKNVIVSQTNFSLLCQINKLVEEGFYYNAGKVRNIPVSISGTKWTPAFPIESIIKEEIEEILGKQECIDKVIELLLYLMKKQIFIDGNKRTAIIFINHYLISNAQGMIVIPSELSEEFKTMLILYYEGKDENKIKEFIKEKCYMKL